MIHTFQYTSREYLNKAHLGKFLATFLLGEKVNSTEFYKMSNNKITMLAMYSPDLFNRYSAKNEVSRETDTVICIT